MAKLRVMSDTVTNHEKNICKTTYIFFIFLVFISLQFSSYCSMLMTGSREMNRLGRLAVIYYQITDAVNVSMMLKSASALFNYYRFNI